MNEWGVFLSLVGVWGWIGSLLVFIFRAFPSRGAFSVRSAMIWGGMIVIFFSCWLGGMLVA